MFLVTAWSATDLLEECLPRDEGKGIFIKERLERCALPRAQAEWFEAARQIAKPTEPQGEISPQLSVEEIPGMDIDADVSKMPQRFVGSGQRAKVGFDGLAQVVLPRRRGEDRRDAEAIVADRPLSVDPGTIRRRASRPCRQLQEVWQVSA